MNRLYAPWRSQYISSIDKKNKGCVFCGMKSPANDKKNLVFYRTTYSLAVLNLYPYSNGHCLVLPHQHVGDVVKLSVSQQQDLMSTGIYVQNLLTRVFKPAGFNWGMNVGRMAGAGIPGHVHLHIVPRWKGDHNFMPVTAQTKVISQSLTEIYKALKHAQSS